MICPKCQQPYEDGLSSCTHCSFVPFVKVCPQCSAPYFGDDPHCVHCGQSLQHGAAVFANTAQCHDLYEDLVSQTKEEHSAQQWNSLRETLSLFAPMENVQPHLDFCMSNFTYCNVKDLMSAFSTAKDWKLGRDKFLSLGDFLDAKEQAQRCHETYQSLTLGEAPAPKVAPPQKKKSPIALIAIVCAVVLVAGAVGFGVWSKTKEKDDAPIYLEETEETEEADAQPTAVDTIAVQQDTAPSQPETDAETDAEADAPSEDVPEPADDNADSKELEQADVGKVVYVNLTTYPDPDDGEETLLELFFDYTNYKEDSSNFANAFQITVYQNGVEIEDHRSLISESSQDAFNKVRQNGTIENVSSLFVLDDTTTPIEVEITFNPSSLGETRLFTLELTGESEAAADAQVDADSPATSEATLWAIDYYVDDFNQPTDEGYVCNTTQAMGTFSNSATTDSLLLGRVLIDQSTISIFLQEYGNNMVKNSYSYDKVYNIKMKTVDGTVHDLTGSIYANGDRIVIDDAYRDLVIDALCDEPLDDTAFVSFYIEQADRLTTTYLLLVPMANFSSTYQTFMGE